ncbi:hypothetical protein [Bradyrhizobium sp. AUGA SZCCT0182]|uniref:hypothetical protein n=1 Tax=Bradyrhizobium sp. AUGA SZCCT0182 TaxID=2807667 RepID=UPI001BA55D38|nr:hypothetical protein [Bradyrhizobium sp. AUGA SZCCT0182]MBR1235042.1 hypothetical protein [Bradyrhizobium sp. AUGA SZCCT0182]
MCIIIDANAANEITSNSPDAVPVLKRVMGGKLRIVAGQQLKIELLKTPFRTLYKQLLLAGRFSEFSDAEVSAAQAHPCVQHCISNDQHVIALARASGARILFSKDEPLHADFKNKAMIDQPRGKIYTCKDHERVLDETVCAC